MLYVFAMIVGAIAGGAICIGVEEVFVIPHEMNVQRERDLKACNAKIALYAAQAQQASNDQVNAGIEAQASVGPLPDDLAALCRSDPLCREHKR